MYMSECTNLKSNKTDCNEKNQEGLNVAHIMWVKIKIILLFKVILWFQITLCNVMVSNEEEGQTETL